MDWIDNTRAITILYRISYKVMNITINPKALKKKLHYLKQVITILIFLS
jgi:hypothetical protein